MNMKRIVAILLAVMLLAALIPAASFAETVSNSSKTAVYHTTASSLNVRAGAGTKYKRIGSLEYGSAFTVTGSSGNWYKIKALRTGKVGWISKSYTSRYAYARVTTKNDPLVIRKGPGTGYAKTGRTIPKGKKNVLVMAISGNWANVKYDGTTGWSSRTYLAWMK